MIVYIETTDRNFTSSKKYEVYSIHVDPKTCETIFLVAGDNGQFEWISWNDALLAKALRKTRLLRFFHVKGY